MPARTNLNKDLSTYHMSANPAAYETQRSNHFVFTVTGLDGRFLLAGVDEDTAEDSDYIVDPGSKIQLSVNASSLPFFSVEESSIRRGNSAIYFPTTVTFEDGSIECHDYIGLATLDALMAWQRLVYDVTTDTVGRMADYKKQCELREYTPDGELVRSWILIGCWPRSITEDNMSMESADGKMITCQFRYDRARPVRNYAIMSGVE